jgi:ABC-type Fe3+-hydroxamate transport system substrate-binding protein
LFVRACLASLLAAGLLGACTKPAAPPAPAGAAQGDSEVLSGLRLSGPGFPLELLSPDGGRARLERPAQRILATNAGLLDLLSELVEPERIVGLPRSARPYSVALERGYALDESRLMDTLDTEAVLSLAPDLVLMRAWQTSEQRWQLERAGVAVLSLPNPESFEAVEQDLRLLARLCDASPRAETLIDQLALRRARLAAGAPARRAWRLIDYSNGGEGGWVAGASTTFDLLCTLIGATNAGAEFPGHARLDLEGLRRLAPDAFILARGTGSAGETATAAFLQAEARLSDLPAVRERRFVELPATLSGTDAHFMLDAAEALAAWVDAAPPPSR